MIRDKFGKEYILNHLLKFTVKFVFRSDEYEKSAYKMKSILKGLNFDSIVMQASIFKYMTMHKPRISLSILENYKQKRRVLHRLIMSDIEEAILTSNKMAKRDRLQLFREFQRKKAQFGISTQLHLGSMTLMGNLMFDVARETKDTNEFDDFIRMAYRKGVPANVIKAWSDKR
mgnify:FL=1